MFDPLANFKLNKIKKGVDSVKAAVDALPTSLSSSFTDVKNAISGVSTKVDSIGTKVDGVGESVSSVAVNPLLREVKKVTFLQKTFPDVGSSGSNLVYETSGNPGRLDYIKALINYEKKLRITLDGVAYTVQNMSHTGISKFAIVSKNSPYVILRADEGSNTFTASYMGLNVNSTTDISTFPYYFYPFTAWTTRVSNPICSPRFRE